MNEELLSGDKTDKEYRKPPKEWQWKPGQSGNPSGRPKNTMKDHIRQKLCAMTPEEKDAWLEEYKITGEIQFKMAEGNPKQDTESKIDGELTIKFDSAFDE